MSIEIEAAKNWVNPNNFRRTEWGDIVEDNLFAKLLVGRALYYYEQQLPTRKYDRPENGMDETGFDCSGFVTRCLMDIGWRLGFMRHARGYYDDWGTSVQLGKQKAGDLVFFSRGDFPDHMGIILTPEHVIHASVSLHRTVAIDPLEKLSGPITKPSELFVSNPIAIKRMTIPQGSSTKIVF